ncbi:SpoIIE family protein phosphatase [Streptomyces sp. NBC_01320]|uniref:SpoIIE family protein phosphatase n=1 Tax=Streptomyces sp. NBC_01320 TaxID=2903824 RepID=UPI002E0F1972|nr:serine/threonine-protein phosphatase [Streptomyces sp. NBC_01320]
MESPAVMGQVRSAAAAYATDGHEPAAITDRTSGLLAEIDPDLLVTCFVLRFDPADDVSWQRAVARLSTSCSRQ